MYYSFILKNPRYIKAFLNRLAVQEHLKGSVQAGRVHWSGIGYLLYKKGVSPAFNINGKCPFFNKNKIATFTFYFGNIQLVFNSKITHLAKNRVTFNKPNKVAVSRRRQSERYTPRESDKISFILPLNGCTVTMVADVGSKGLSLISDKPLSEPGNSVPNCILHTKTQDFTVTCIFRYVVKLTEKKWKCGVNIDFSDELSYMVYLEWLFHLFHSDVYTPAHISSEDLKTCLENTRSVLITNDATRIENLNTELRLWGAQNRISPLQCNIARIKSQKLLSACTTKRIYNNTFVTQRMVCVPGIHLNDSPKLSLYQELSEFLINHPGCNYLIQYKDRDIEWHESLFKELVNYSQDSRHVCFDKLAYLEVSIEDTSSKCLSKSSNPYTCTLLENPNEFARYLRQHECMLLINAYNYLEMSHDIEINSELSLLSNTSMQRRVFLIRKSNSIVGYAVCEVFDKEYMTDNTLDMCRLHLCTDVKNIPVLLNKIVDDISPFFIKKNKKRFRIVWKGRKGGEFRQPVKGKIYHGTLLRLIVSKKGLSLLQQIIQISREKITKYFHLSYPQQSIWEYEQLFPATTINTIFCTITMKDPVEFTLLKKAIKTVVEKNDAVRIQITRRHGKPCQHVRQADVSNIDFVDFSISNNPETFFTFRNKIKQEPVPLYDSELFRFIMFRKKNGKCGYFIKAHHIVADAWTIGNITNSIFELYLSLIKNNSIRYYNAPSYIAFLRKEFEYRFSDTLEMQRNFWFEYLRDSSISSMGDSLINKKLTGVSKRMSFAIKGKTAKNISEYMRITSCTAFSFFISCLYIYLFKTTGDTTITIGTSVLNRSGPQERATAGLFVGARPFKLSIDCNSSFIKLTRQVALAMRKLLKNHKYPSELLLKNLRAEGFRNNRLYEITFTYQNYKLRPDFSLVWHPYSFQTEALNVHVNDWEGKGAFYIDYDYHTAKFSGEDIRRMHEHILAIIEQVVEHSECAITMISMISPNERTLIFNNFNNTSAQYPREATLHQLFEKQVKKDPCKTALIENNYSLTYGQLNRKANRLARLLFLLYHEQINNCIGILIENSTHQIIAQLGVLKSGNTYVPLDTKAPRLRTKSIIDDAKIKLLLTVSGHNYEASRLQWECLTLLNVVFLDTHETNIPEEWSNQPLMNLELWEHIGRNAYDEITAGGWVNSYTGEPFSNREMEEFGDNALLKLKKYLSPSKRILEIGCASGITMFRIASQVKHYCGTDLSETVISRNREFIEKKNISNISLLVLPAHRINTLKKNKFDIIIINSVIQAFPGYNYLRNVINDAISLLNPTGLIFVGDVMDLDRKQELIESLEDYKEQHPDESSKTKNDFSYELFVPKSFFDNLKKEIKEIHKIEFSGKIHSIENELTNYRYDTLLHINKKGKKKIESSTTPINVYGTDDFKYNDATDLNIPLNSSVLAYIIYTSGTSGKPKGVMIEHRSVINLCWWYIKYYNLTKADKIARSISFCFDPSVAELFTGLLSGAAIIIVPNEIVHDPSLLNTYFNINKVSVCILPTPLFEPFQRQPNNSLRLVVVGGDKLSKYIKSNYSVFNNYGPTENTVITTVFPVDRQYDNIPIGKPIANTAIYILDENDNLSPIGISGELCISGDGLARGYINNVDSDKFVENPFVPGVRMYRTGDKARWLSDGNIEFIGRKDDQIKLRGFRIELKEIEAVLLRYSEIRNAAVLCKESGNGDKFLCAYYEAPCDIDRDVLVDFLSERLPYYMLPGSYVRLDVLPLLSSGKIDRRMLDKLKDAVPLTEEAIHAPETVTGRMVAEIWKTILERRQIGEFDNFFMIGGDSLSAIEACSAFSKKNISVKVQELYDFPTVSSLAAHIDGKVISKTNPALPMITCRKRKERLADITQDESERSLKNVLITGSTGYLGIHLLKQLLDRTEAHIFCLIRGGSMREAEKRLETIFRYYFNRISTEVAMERITILRGDVCDTNLSLSLKKYRCIIDNVETVFNCAALVKFYGTYEEFRRINYEGLNHIVDFAEKAAARLYHISTMGIAGGPDIRQDNPDSLFTENDLYTGQHYMDNPYVRSKFEAENYLVDKINNRMDATIFRLGQITERWSDGVFQRNVQDNYFHSILKALCTVGIVPGKLLLQEIDLSPVDLCSEAILRLAVLEKCSGRIFHIYNPNQISFAMLFEFLKNEKIQVRVLPNLTHREYIGFLRKNCTYFRKEIDRLAADFNFDTILAPDYSFRTDATITGKYLEQVGFRWPAIDAVYIGKMVKHLRDINFL
jgi:amino acid adenylation domain-containing protein/thioester reductase-like protein